MQTRETFEQKAIELLTLMKSHISNGDNKECTIEFIAQSQCSVQMHDSGAHIEMHQLHFVHGETINAHTIA